jgi:hypothetical protein
MPLSTTEVKNLLKDVFRLVIALNKDDQPQALSAFSSILDTAMDDEYADMPPLETATVWPPFRPVHPTPIETLFRPTAERATVERPTAERPTAERPTAERYVTEHAPLHTSSTTEDEVHLVITEQPEDELSVIEPQTDDDEGVEAVELDDDGNEVTSPQEEEEEEEEVPAEEEEVPAEEEEVPADEVELDLEPVRIRKVIYWKDKESGDLYQYLPDDEVGDKVGSYVNGVPVFE